MMLKGRPNQGESRGALGERRQSLPPTPDFVRKRSKTLSIKIPWLTTCPPRNFRLSYGSVMEAGGGL
jgi:hypothetical protein